MPSCGTPKRQIGIAWETSRAANGTRPPEERNRDAGQDSFFTPHANSQTKGTAAIDTPAGPGASLSLPTRHIPLPQPLQRARQCLLGDLAVGVAGVLGENELV